MNSRTLAIVLGILLVLAIVYIGFTSGPGSMDTDSATTTAPVATSTTEDTTDTAAVTVTTTVTATYENATSNDIRLETPEAGATTGSSFTVSGEARGSWYFEASFPVRVVDANGATLATVAAQAQGDWMTTDFVPFTVQVSIPSSYHGPATVVLAKDNPSGNPSMDASLSVPITIR